MQEGTVISYVGDGDNRTLVLRTKSGGKYTHRIDPSCKIVVTPTGTVDDVVEGDTAQFSGQPATELRIHRQNVATVREPAPTRATKPTVSKQLADAHDNDDADDEELKTPHKTTPHPKKHK